MKTANDLRLDWRISDVAAWFGVTRMTIHRWMTKDDNPLPHHRVGSGRGIPRFNSREVKEWGYCQ